MFNPVPKPHTHKKSAVAEWNAVRKKLKETFEQLNITSCEMCRWEHDSGYTLRSPELGSHILSFAHRHKRIWYKSRPDLLGNINQVILSCQTHHSLMEYDKYLTERWFTRLRGPEISSENVA